MLKEPSCYHYSQLYQLYLIGSKSQFDYEFSAIIKKGWNNKLEEFFQPRFFWIEDIVFFYKYQRFFYLYILDDTRMQLHQ